MMKKLEYSSDVKLTTEKPEWNYDIEVAMMRISILMTLMLRSQV